MPSGQGPLIDNGGRASDVVVYGIDGDCGTLDPCDSTDGIDIIGATFEYTTEEAQ